MKQAQNQAFICDAIRTPIGRYGGVLSSVRTDDLGAIPLAALMARNPSVDWSLLDDVIYGCVNQAGEDNRNVAHRRLCLQACPIRLPAQRLTACADQALMRLVQQRVPSKQARWVL
jgi:acetyl-CoA acyltransferase